MAKCNLCGQEGEDMIFEGMAGNEYHERCFELRAIIAGMIADEEHDLVELTEDKDAWVFIISGDIDTVQELLNSYGQTEEADTLVEMLKTDISRRLSKLLERKVRATTMDSDSDPGEFEDHLPAQFVSVNEGQDMWEIDYETGKAEYIGQRVTLDDLKLNNRESEYESYDGFIGDYLEEFGFENVKQVDEEHITFTVKN